MMKYVGKCRILSVCVLTLTLTLTLTFGGPFEARSENPPVLEQAWEAAGLILPESVLYDAERKVIYVSNMGGGPQDKDAGFISKLGMDGQIQELKWVTGLNGTTGMGLKGTSLYVAEVNDVAEINVETGKVADRYPVGNTGYLNDIAMDDAGTIYVTETVEHAIYRIKGGKAELLVKDPIFEAPNGLSLDGDRLIVASAGVPSAPDAKSPAPGHVRTFSLADKSIEFLSTSDAPGNLDGLTPPPKH
ncbi:MAG: hypothetical protein D3916_05560, partial [Candidatus Electrothrix sp. MAN1_4]|nr:hypothetical protein [Candidatus Electrothrix sp. MAN1_4]